MGSRDHGPAAEYMGGDPLVRGKVSPRPFDRSVHCCCCTTNVEHMDKKKIGEPLGNPANKGVGDAQPEEAGAEGGLGSWGDQRDEQERNERRERDQHREKDPPLDGTVRKEHIEGDTDEKRPGASLTKDPICNGPRLSMELRKREPLIIW
jgi:hypothetical protein